GECSRSDRIGARHWKSARISASGNATGQGRRGVSLMKVRTSLIGLLVVFGIGVCGVGAAAAQPAGPAAGYNIDAGFTQKSPDGATTIEQYVNKETDDWQWQFWARRDGTFNLLDAEPAGYPAGFRFTNDSKWVVRMQKTGSGELSLYLYRLGPQGFV